MKIIYPIAILLLVILLAGIHIVRETDLKSRREGAQIALEAELKELERATVLFFSRRYFIGGGVLIQKSAKGEEKTLIVTARHVFDLAKTYGLREGSFRIAFAAADANGWKVVTLPAAGAHWFSLGAAIDVAALDLTPYLSRFELAGARPKILQPVTHSEIGELYAICANVYRDLAEESRHERLHSPILGLSGYVIEEKEVRVGAKPHSVLVSTFDNFMKDGYSGSPVYTVTSDDDRTVFRVELLGVLSLAIDGGRNAGVSRIEPLLEAMR